MGSTANRALARVPPADDLSREGNQLPSSQPERGSNDSDRRGRSVVWINGIDLRNGHGQIEDTGGWFLCELWSNLGVHPGLCPGMNMTNDSCFLILNSVMILAGIPVLSDRCVWGLP